MLACHLSRYTLGVDWMTRITGVERERATSWIVGAYKGAVTSMTGVTVVTHFTKHIPVVNTSIVVTKSQKQRVCKLC
jgi:hypothetical protein